MNSVCCIGHITLDKIVTPRGTTYLSGGTSYYFSHAISRLKKKVNYRLITALAESEMKAVEELRAQAIDVTVLPSAHTVYFENIYGEDINHRTQRVLAKADPFTVEKLSGEQADIFHLGTLLADDCPLSLVRDLAQRGRVSADAQGYLREVRGEDVFAVDWTDKLAALPYISILKVNEHEAEVLTGIAEPEAAARQLADWGVKEVVLTLGSLGSIILFEGEIHHIPAYPPREIVDATGCGDTYMAGYLYMRTQHKTCAEAGRFAAALSTLKLEKYGAFSGTEEEVRAIIDQHLLPTYSEL